METSATSARRGATALLIAAALYGGAAGLAPAAFAEDTTPPPSWTASPATSAAAQSGDGRNYWADDSCHYYQQGGQWRSDLCWTPSLDRTGAPAAGQLSLVPRIEPGLPPAQELLRIDTSDPEHLAIRDGSPLFTTVQWVRVSRDDPNGPIEAEVFDQTQNGYVWLPLADLVKEVQAGNGARYGFSTAQGSGSPSFVGIPASDPSVTQAFLDMARNTVAQPMRPCEWATNGC